MPKKTNCNKNGNSYYRVTTTIGKTPEGKPIRKEFYGKSKSDAEQQRDDYLYAIKSGLSIDFKKIKLSVLMRMWLFDVLRPSEMKPTTFDKHEGLYRNYIRSSIISDLVVAEIRSIQIQKYYNTLYSSGVTPKTIKNIHKTLRYFFNYCLAGDYIIKNPCFKLNIPGKIEEKTTKEIDPFDDNEIKKFSAALAGNKIETLILLALGSGIREGELLGLNFNDIDLKQCTLNINKELKRVKIIFENGTHEYKRILQPAKTKKVLVLRLYLQCLFQYWNYISGDKKRSF